MPNRPKALTKEEMEAAFSKAQHPIDEDYPVVVSLHILTGVAVEYCLRENPEFTNWEAEQKRRGRSIVDATIGEVVKDLERTKACGRPQRWKIPGK